jgi:G:T-mismatch repair DNA endonuclease (very short patch repair protein)
MIDIRLRRLYLFTAVFGISMRIAGGETSPKAIMDTGDAKLDRNVERDAENVCKLEEAGWHVLVIWECELKDLDSVLKNFWRLSLL